MWGPQSVSRRFPRPCPPPAVTMLLGLPGPSGSLTPPPPPASMAPQTSVCGNPFNRLLSVAKEASLGSRVRGWGAWSWWSWGTMGQEAGHHEPQQPELPPRALCTAPSQGLNPNPATNLVSWWPPSASRCSSVKTAEYNTYLLELACKFSEKRFLLKNQKRNRRWENNKSIKNQNISKLSGAVPELQGALMKQ